MKPDLYWIPGPWRGKLAVSTRPRGGDWLDDEIAGWRGDGLDVVVSLLEKEEASQLQLDREGVATCSKGIEFVSFPVPDRGIPLSVPKALAFLEAIAMRLEKGRNVAVHCRQGIGRSGLVAAGLLMIAGTSVEDAVRTVSAARGVTIPETATQLEWLERLSSMRPSLTSG